MHFSSAMTTSKPHVPWTMSARSGAPFANLGPTELEGSRTFLNYKQELG